MLYSESPPFPLGTTLYDGSVPTDTSLGDSLKGHEWYFPDDAQGDNGVNAARSGRERRFRIVKNDKGSAALPKYCVTLDTYGQEINGLAAEAAAGADFGIVDEHLPAAGCANQDYCWVLVDGISTCIVNGNSVNIATGDMLTMDTGGLLRKVDVTELDGDLYSEINGRVGRSINGSTISTDAADCIVNVKFGG